MQLESKVTEIPECFKQLNVSPSSPPSYPQNSLQAYTAFDLINEFSDQESQKCNVIVHNLPESPAPTTNTDTPTFNNPAVQFYRCRGSNYLSNLTWQEVNKQKQTLTCMLRQQSKQMENSVSVTTAQI